MKVLREGGGHGSPIPQPLKPKPDSHTRSPRLFLSICHSHALFDSLACLLYPEGTHTRPQHPPVTRHQSYGVIQHLVGVFEGGLLLLNGHPLLLHTSLPHVHPTAESQKSRPVSAIAGAKSGDTAGCRGGGSNSAGDLVLRRRLLLHGTLQLRAHLLHGLWLRLRDCTGGVLLALTTRPLSTVRGMPDISESNVLIVAKQRTRAR